MRNNEWLGDNLKDTEFRHLFELETLVEEFCAQIEQTMQRDGITIAELAHRVNCEKWIVTAAFEEPPKMPLTMLVHMAAVLGLRPVISLQPLESNHA
jgi:ribosome-binding protein aMBF1 (putative translation factor)